MENTLSTVICTKKCKDYESCSRNGIPKVRTKPVMQFKTISDRKKPGFKKLIELPIACICVPKNTTLKKHKRRKSKVEKMPL